MTALLVIVCASATVFAMVQAVYFRQRARQAQMEAALRERMGVDEGESLFRKSHQRKVAVNAALLVEQAGLSWSVHALFQGGMGLALALGFLGALASGPQGFLIGLILGPLLLYGYLRRARDQRIEKISRQTSRALELLILTLRAGHALPRALALVSEDVPRPIRDELKRVSDEHALGRPLEEAFLAMSRRLQGCAPLRMFVTGILVLRQTGGNLIEVIERIVGTLSSNEAYRQKLRAATAEGRTSALMMVAIPAFFLVVSAIFRPDQAGFLLRDPTGQKMTLVALILWICGGLWVFRLTSSRA